MTDEPRIRASAKSKPPARARAIRTVGNRPGRPTKDAAIKLRRHLLNVATQEFLKKGFEGTSIDGIAAASKISKMTIYRQFRNKEDLFRAVAMHSNERFERDLIRISDETGDPEEVLLDFARASYDDPSAPEMVEMTRLAIAEAKKFPDVAYAFYQQRDVALRPLTEYLSRLNREGVLDLPNPRLAAIQFMALASGGVRPLMVPRDSIEAMRETWIRSAVSLFLDGSRIHGELGAGSPEAKATAGKPTKKTARSPATGQRKQPSSD